MGEIFILQSFGPMLMITYHRTKYGDLYHMGENIYVRVAVMGEIFNCPMKISVLQCYIYASSGI